MNPAVLQDVDGNEPQTDWRRPTSVTVMLWDSYGRGSAAAHCVVRNREWSAGSNKTLHINGYLLLPTTWHQLRDLIVHIPRNAFIHWVLKNVPVSRRRRGATAGWLAACLCHRQDRTGQEMKRPFKGDTRGEQVSRTWTRRTKPSKHVWYQDRTEERLQRLNIKNVG